MSAAERGEFDNVFEFPALAALGAGTVGPGASGWEVEELQGRLVKLGFTGLQTTGTYDALTQAAVAAIQRGMKKPDTGVFDNFLDATLTRALDVTGSLEAQVVEAAAAEFRASAAAAASASSLPATVAAPGSPQTAPMVVQVPGDQAAHQPTKPIWKQPLFWITLLGGSVALYSIFKTPTLPTTATPGEPGEDGVDDPESFFAEAPKKRKRRKPRAKKKALPATVSDETDGDEPEDIPEDTAGVEDVEAGAAPAEVEDIPEDTATVSGTEKPKKKKRRKKATGGLPERDEKGHFLPRS